MIATAKKLHGKIIDETGNVYSQLTVLEFSGQDKRGIVLWRCRCDCGGEVIVLGTGLRRGRVKNCGCWNPRTVDLTGEKYGRLTVTGSADRDAQGRARWAKDTMGYEEFRAWLTRAYKHFVEGQNE